MKFNSHLFCDFFDELATTCLTQTPLLPPSLTEALDYLFTNEGFASPRGNKIHAAQALGFTAIKAFAPKLDATRLIGRMRKTDEIPAFRTMCQIPAAWVRRNLDAALCGPDPGAGARRSATPRMEDGHYRDERLKRGQIMLAHAAEAGFAEPILAGILHRYRRMADSRRPMVAVTHRMTEAVTQRLIARFVDSPNRANRVQAVVWAGAAEVDTVAWPEALTTSDHRKRVADIDLGYYAIEATAIYLTLDKVQDTCAKARASARCQRVVFVVGQPTVCGSEAALDEIVAVIAHRYPDIEVVMTTLTDYLRVVASGTGRATWISLVARINLAVQNLLPYDSNQWNDLLAGDRLCLPAAA